MSLKDVGIILHITYCDEIKGSKYSLKPAKK